MLENVSSTMTPLFDDGWITFNEEKWGLKSRLVELGPKKGDAWYIKSVVYSRKDGLLVNPPRNPYIPVEFECVPGRMAVRNRRYRTAINELAVLFKEEGVYGGIALSSNVTDVRPFLDAGFSVSPKYTYYINIERFEQEADPAIFNKARKAQRLGYQCMIREDYDAVQECLRAPEQRNGFDHRVAASDLFRLRNLLGDDKFVCFMVMDKFDNPQGAWVCVFTPGGYVLAWSAGVKSEALKDGVNNLLGAHAMAFFREKDCRVFDFVGANMPGVADMKEAWGGQLVSYFTIRQNNVRNFVRDAYHTIRAQLHR